MAKKLKKLTPTLGAISNPQNEEIVFSFKNLKSYSYNTATNDGAFFIRYLERLSKISSQTWAAAYTTDRHGIAGIESMKVASLTEAARNLVPSGIESLIVMRTSGDNHVFLGHRIGNIFNVIFIEHEFGEVYNHGK
ncbi:hypothetical protein [Fibrobacter sp. UWB7]|uniref:hypothetical protein n=1 Tax=Fibrobacter sp. UWB7 TaxID=1896206 RepID=UPI00091F94DB|nr:hypothetical protein [Fibrobacter sp. UWB7]SHM37328.1 hypothetical protein SAMN05720467_1113 [Fibrobacter sp. UWB7]